MSKLSIKSNKSFSGKFHERLFFFKYNMKQTLSLVSQQVQHEGTVILVIMYVKIFKTAVNVFICDVKMCLTSHWLIIFNISQFLRVTNWPNIFVDQRQFSDPNFISGEHQRENVPFADKYLYWIFPSSCLQAVCW
jgi:cellulose synthase/poly-beta-1,6-N-acetylglucosamine synthase-like glycosyltransferase